MMFAVESTRAEQKTIGKVIVEPYDCIVGQKRELLTIRIVTHVTSTILKVAVEIEVAVEIAHRLLQVIHDVANVYMLIVRRVHLIVEELVVA